MKISGLSECTTEVQHIPTMCHFCHPCKEAAVASEMDCTKMKGEAGEILAWHPSLNKSRFTRCDEMLAEASCQATKTTVCVRPTFLAFVSPRASLSSGGLPSGERIIVCAGRDCHPAWPPGFLERSWRREGCSCDDGVAAQERGCSLLPECGLLPKLHFAAGPLRWQQPLFCTITR